MSVRVGIVVPCYNEEDVLPETSGRLLGLLERLVSENRVSPESKLYFVDDGSHDRTWSVIESIAKSHDQVHGIKLSRNQGHQNALLAGLFTAEGEAIISIDADLQDDINVIEDMVERYNEGHDIVYGVRSSRSRDSAFKRITAQFYYRTLTKMGVDLVYNHADYRLMSRRAVDCLREYDEVNLFLRGIIPQLGFRTASVYFERAERFAGESKYPVGKMIALAIDGIASFSTVPLRMIAMLGFLVCFGSLIMVAWIVVGKFALNSTVPGWASTVLPIYFLGGIQLFCIGILGEYVAKVYMETKRRPRYFIERII